MQRVRKALTVAALLGLAGCQTTGYVPEAPRQANLSKEIRSVKPEAKSGECWAGDTAPLVIETEMKQRQIAPEARDAKGKLLRPATFESVTQQKIVQERGEIWFRSLCPEKMDATFLTSLQRALKARGLYLLPLSGKMDKATRQAVRRYQSPLGLESEVLSLAAARDLGLVVTEIPR